MIKDTIWKFFRETFLRFFSSSAIHSSVRRTFHFYFKKFFSDGLLNLKASEDQIIMLSVFLLISFSFMCKKKKEKYFDFDWKSYLHVFNKQYMRGFLLCSIRYLMDSGKIHASTEQVKEKFPDLKPNFLQQYMCSIVYKDAKDFNTKINVNKYIELLNLSLIINSIYCNEIPKNSSKVIDLVSYTTEWKQKMLEVFDYKAEYIVFSFFINLSK